MEAREREVLQARMADLADGDRDAFDDVYALVSPLVRGFVGSQLRPAEAEDAAQEALIRVFARASAFDPRRDALSWILGIAAWEIRTARQRERRRREDAIGDAAFVRPAEDPLPDELAEARERGRFVDEALAMLRPEDAATLRAYMNEERPAVAPATFRKRLQRAVERARTSWRMGHGPQR
jgi:RNA polymerase sigma-70 factor, ECF subfamily